MTLTPVSLPKNRYDLFLLAFTITLKRHLCYLLWRVQNADVEAGADQAAEEGDEHAAEQGPGPSRLSLKRQGLKCQPTVAQISLLDIGTDQSGTFQRICLILFIR